MLPNLSAILQNNVDKTEFWWTSLNAFPLVCRTVIISASGIIPP